MGRTNLRIAERVLAKGRLVALSSAPGNAEDAALIEREADAVAAALAQLWSQPAFPPRAQLRERVLAATRRDGTLDGFSDRVALLLDWPRARIASLMRSVDPADVTWVDGPGAGIRIRPLEPGPRHGSAVAGLVWCAPGSVFPEHRHHGPEWALVLAGAARNSAGEHWSVGDLVYFPAGTIHSFAIPAGGVPLLAVVVIRRGLEFL